MICSNCKSNVSNDSLYCSKCGHSLIASDLQITRNDYPLKKNNAKPLNFKNGESFGKRYRIISEIGKGGMGQVFKAHDNVLNIDVALKMIRPEFLMNKRMISRFKQEILLAREITHENVSRIYDFGDVEGTKFISMEFINGRTLKDIIKKEGPIEIKKAIEISKAVCKGLAAAHKKEIIHRDLKPQNIMIDENDHVYITDFGLAKSVREEDVSHTGLVIGTPQYIPPELWKGEVADKRSDIYSLGILMYEMVTGMELFQSDSDYGYLQKHVNEEPKFPEFIKDKIPTFYKNLILKCLYKERGNRYQECNDIYTDLEDRIFSKGTFISEIERSLKKTGPVKIFFSISIILFVSFIGSLILNRGPNSPQKRSVAILYFKNLSGIKNLDHFSFSLPELLITDLGQSKYIKVLPEEKISKILQKSNYLSTAFIDEKMIEDIGNQANVNYLVQGSFIKSGNELRITIKLRDSDSGKIISTDYVDVTMDNIFPSIDRLTLGLKRRFNLTENEIFADIDSEIETITTSSQKALNYYISGKRLFKERKFKESLIEYQKAVEIDPEFAMAYKNMAWSYAHLYNWGKRKEYYKKTLQYVNKLSVREKYLIYGSFYRENEKTYQKSIDSYKKILEIYNYDFEANYRLGVFYRLFEEWDKAIDYCKKALSEDRSNIYVLSEIINCYFAKGEYDKAEEWIKKYRKENGKINIEKILSLLFRLRIFQNKFDLASDIIDRRNELSKTDGSGIKYNKGLIDILRGDYKSAERIIFEQRKNPNLKSIPSIRKLKYLFLFKGKYKKYESLLKSEISHTSFIGNLIELKSELINFYLTSGFYDKATSELLSVDLEKNELFPTEMVLFISLRILNELEKGNIELSESLIKQMKELSEISFYKKLSNRKVYQVSAKFFEKKGEYEKAEDLYLKSIKNIGKLDNAYTAPYFYNPAVFYYRQKKYEKAEKLFKHIVNQLTFGKYYRGDIYAKSVYFLGNIYQKKGWNGKAIESFENFLNLWKDGDTELIKSYIKNTKEQLNLLKKNI